MEMLQFGDTNIHFSLALALAWAWPWLGLTQFGDETANVKIESRPMSKTLNMIHFD